MNNQILVIIAGVIFLSYAIYCQIKWSWLSSYSKSYYEIPSKKVGFFRLRWIFQIWVLSLAILVSLIGKEYPYYIFSGLLSIVAFFPTIKNKKHFKWHLTSAISSIIGLGVYLNIVYWDSEFLNYFAAASLIVAYLQMWVDFIQNSLSKKLGLFPNWVKYIETFAFSYIILILYYNV